MEIASWIGKLIYYLNALAPVAAICVSLYGLIYPKTRRLESFLLFNDVTQTFIIAINNTGGSSVVLRSIELYAKSKSGKVEMGKRACLSNSEEKLITIFPGGTFSYAPQGGVVYDVLGDDIFNDFSRLENDGPVYIVVTDARGHTYRSKTGLKLKEIGDILAEKNEMDRKRCQSNLADT